MRQGLSPRNIIDNLPHIDYNAIKYEIGMYIQVHVQARFTNTMKARTVPAIVLDPKTNMSLETVREIEGRAVAQNPINQEVIDRVEALGLEQQQPFTNTKMLQYEWRPGQPMHHHDVRQFDIPMDTGIIPDPVMNIQDPGPNPLVDTIVAGNGSTTKW